MSTLEAPPAAPASNTPPPAAPSTPPAPQASAVQTAWFRDYIKEDGTLNPSALDRLPDHLKPLKSTWERAKTFEDLGTMHLNSQHLNGKKALAPLPADAPEAVKTERKALLDSLHGVPPTPKDYGIARPADLPEQFWSEPAANNLAAWAHKHSVSPAAAKELMSTHAELIKGQAAEHEQYVSKYQGEQQTAFEAQIRQENIPAERAAALVEKGAIALGLDPTSEATQKLFKDSALVRLMAMRHAISTGEDTTVTANSQGSAQPDPEMAANDIRTNTANPLHAAFWNKGGTYSRTQQEQAVAKHNELLKLAAAKPKK